MAAITEQISRLLREAGETHHRVFRIVDGADDDWASWYADWLVNLSELPSLLGTKAVRSELTYLLVSLDKDYNASQPGNPGKCTTPSGSSITSVPPAAELATKGSLQCLQGTLAHGPLIGCCAGPSSRRSHRRKAVAKRGFAAASSRAVTGMIREVLARQGGELVVVNPAAQ